MTACATLTRRVRVSANVLCNSFRSPALLAKMGATLDVISGGRFELAMGAGWHEPEYHAYGFEFPTAGVRIGQLAEAVRLIKQLWTGEPVDFEGRYYRVRGGRCRPRPLQSPRPPIVIGGAGREEDAAARRRGSRHLELLGGQLRAARPQGCGSARNTAGRRAATRRAWS